MGRGEFESGLGEFHFSVSHEVVATYDRFQDQRMSNPLPTEQIEHRILLIRRQKVMLDAHLAELYAVETRELRRLET